MALETEMSDEELGKLGFRPPRDLDKKEVSAYGLWQLHKRKLDLREAYMAHWNSTVSQTGTGRPIDAIICPAAPYAAPPHGHNK
jgi:amidase